MTANQWISVGLLIGRLITICIMSVVIRKQYRVIRAKEYPELKRLRVTLLTGSVVVIAGNIIPIIIDAFGIINKGSYALLLAYVFSNNITAIISAYVMWYSIRISEKTQIMLEKSGRDRTDV